MRYSICAVAVTLIPFLAACGIPSATTSETGAATDDTADTLGQKSGPVTFSGSLDGQLTSSTEIAPSVLARVTEATGRAPRFGKFTVTISHVRNTATAAEDGSYEFTTHKGDTITATFTGQGTFVINGTITVTDTVTIIGGTGRYAGATGSFQATRVYTMATGEASGSFSGQIVMP